MEWQKDYRLIVQDDFKDLISRPLSDRDKLGLNFQVTGIQNQKYPNSVILRNFCKRTGVSKNLLMKYVKSKHWIDIFQQLHARRMV